jgi:hypothetical protein
LSSALQWNADGTFKFDRVEPGEYSVSIGPVESGNPAASLYLKEARFGSIDLLTHPLLVTGPRSDEIVITLGQNGGRISGIVQGAKTVVLVPNERDRRHLYRSFSSANGRFTLQGVPPGSYKIFAFVDVEPGEWFDPVFFSAFEASGVPVEVGESANISFNGNLVPVRLR